MFITRESKRPDIQHIPIFISGLLVRFLEEEPVTAIFSQHFFGNHPQPLFIFRRIVHRRNQTSSCESTLQPPSHNKLITNSTKLLVVVTCRMTLEPIPIISNDEKRLIFLWIAFKMEYT